MAYEVLKKSSGLEIRKYPPCRRTITVCNRPYFLQFPYMVFARKKYGDRVFFYVAFAKEDDDVVYFPPLSNIESHFNICLGHIASKGGYTHYGHFDSIKGSFDQLLNTFWLNEFGPYQHWPTALKALRKSFGRLTKWRGMDLEAVMANMGDPIPFKAFVEEVKKNLTGRQMEHQLGEHRTANGSWWKDENGWE